MCLSWVPAPVAVWTVQAWLQNGVLSRIAGGAMMVHVADDIGTNILCFSSFIFSGWYHSSCFPVAVEGTLLRQAVL